jgi:hypothetical protein
MFYITHFSIIPQRSFCAKPAAFTKHSALSLTYLTYHHGKTYSTYFLYCIFKVFCTDKHLQNVADILHLLQYDFNIHFTSALTIKVHICFLKHTHSLSIWYLHCFLKQWITHNIQYSSYPKAKVAQYSHLTTARMKQQRRVNSIMYMCTKNQEF